MPRVTTPTIIEAAGRMPAAGGRLTLDAVLTAERLGSVVRATFRDDGATVSIDYDDTSGALAVTAIRPGGGTIPAPAGRVVIPDTIVARANRWMSALPGAVTLHRDWHDKCHGLRVGPGQVRWLTQGVPTQAVTDGTTWTFVGGPTSTPRRPAGAPRAARTAGSMPPAIPTPAPMPATVPGTFVTGTDTTPDEPAPPVVNEPQTSSQRTTTVGHGVPAAYRTPVVLSPQVRAAWRAYHGMTVALVGPSGAGKTHAVYTLSGEDGHEVVKFDASGVIEPGDWFGTVALDKDGTRFVESDLLVALTTEGARTLLIDEANRAALRAANALLPILDGSATFTVPQTGRTVKRNPDVRVVFTLNRGADFLGIEPLDRALSNRVSAWIEIDDLAEEDEIKVLLDRTPGLKREHAEGLARLGRLVREASAQSRQHAPVSTRQLLAAARAMARGLKPEWAVEASILCEYSGEGGAKSPRAKVRVHATGIDWVNGTGTTGTVAS